MNAHEFIFDSIGSRFWLESLDGGTFDDALKKEIFTYATNFDDTYSRFKDNSLVSQLAKSGHINNPPAEMLRMLEFSKRMYEASEGAFNITVGATLHKFGYGSREHGGEVIADPWRKIVWDSKQVICPKGLMLDFGGFGKGWMIDAISDILRAHGVSQFIVNGGGDLYVQSDSPIDIALENPLIPNAVLGSVKITRGALAGSNTIKRSWKDGTVTKHHIIDPALSDSSDSGVIASYVTADSALIADALATVVIISPQLKDALEAKFNAKIMFVTN